MLQPNKRPLLVHSYNRFHQSFGLGGKLDADQLIRKARRKTGLRDLGPDFNDEALHILLQSVNEEARLHPFGRLMMREKLTGQLENRLWAQHWFKRFPEIQEQELLPILLITGLQRTGTTKIQRLLSQQPGARPLPSWEALYPAPVGKPDEKDIRLARTRRNERAVKWLSPTFHAIHPIYHDRPEEDVLLLDQHFMSTSSEAVMHAPTYAGWLGRQDPTEAYRYEKRLLQLLQWQRNGRYWVLKSPHHLEYLDAFTKVFPNTHIIWMHREVERCVPSFLSMLYHSRRLFSDAVKPEEIKVHWVEKMQNMVRRGLDFREHHPDRIIDVAYHNLIRDERATLRRIFEEVPFLREAEISNMPAPPDRGYVSEHRYELKDWALENGELNARFRAYDRYVENQLTFRK